MPNKSIAVFCAIVLTACCAVIAGPETVRAEDPLPDAKKTQAEEPSLLSVKQERIRSLQKKLDDAQKSAVGQVELNRIVEEIVANKTDEAAINKSIEDYAGLGFGIALGYRTLKNCSGCVKEAQLVNGIVRITEEQDDIIGFMLETHYFLPFGKNKLQGIGPFVSIDPGSESDPLRSVGAGIMYGGRYDAKQTKSFNIGIGYAVDNKIKVLGDGILANQPLPAGEAEIRYKKVSRHGLMALLSFSF